MLSSFTHMSDNPGFSASNATRVLIVCHDRFLSGANRALIDWLDGRDRAKADITVLLPRDNADTRMRLEEIGCEVWHAPFVLAIKPVERRGLVWHIKNNAKFVWSLCAHPFISRYVAKKALARGIQVVHSNSFATTFGSEIAHLLDVPHIWHIREFCETDHGFTHYFPSRVARQCEASHAIFISEAVKEYQTKKYSFKSEMVVYDRVQCVGSICGHRSFMNDGICNIIMVGTISEGKGQQEAIEAIKMLQEEGRNVRLFLCGQGDRNMLQPLLVGCESFIFDLGYREDVNEIRTGMDIALVCSRMEAFGRVTIEGQYYWNVVIGADSGCTSHLIDDGKTGFLYRKGDPRDLAKKITYCMDNPCRMSEITNTARASAVREYAGDISEKIFATYTRVLSASVSALLDSGVSRRGTYR